MILIDANLLIYAYNPASRHHAAARTWLEAALSGPPPARLSWTIVLAFFRIATSPGVFEAPFSVQEAVSIIDAWLQQPAVAILEAGENHWEILKGLLSKAQVRGRMVMDAHLAALAIEHGATLCTADKDFTRFPGLKLLYPLERG